MIGGNPYFMRHIERLKSLYRRFTPSGNTFYMYLCEPSPLPNYFIHPIFV